MQWCGEAQLYGAVKHNRNTAFCATFHSGSKLSFVRVCVCVLTSIMSGVVCVSLSAISLAHAPRPKAGRTKNDPTSFPLSLFPLSKRVKLNSNPSLFGLLAVLCVSSDPSRLRTQYKLVSLSASVCWPLPQSTSDLVNK